MPSSVMTFSFNAVELCVVSINEKPGTRAREVRRAFEYNKKTADVVKAFCSQENYAQKYQTGGFTAAGKPVDWPKDSQKYDIYIKEEGMYEIFSGQQPRTKEFRKHCCNVLFPHFRQRLTNKMQEEHQQAIEEKDNQIQAFEFTYEKHEQKILKLYEEIDDLIINRHVPFVDILATYRASLERLARRPTHITLSDVNIDSLKNIKNVLNFITQTVRRSAGVMIQMLFTDGTYSRVK